MTHKDVVYLTAGALAGLLFTGCVKRPILIGCIDRKPEVVEGPVIVNGNDVIFHDKTGKLHKLTNGTCGIKAVNEGK